VGVNGDGVGVSVAVGQIPGHGVGVSVGEGVAVDVFVGVCDAVVVAVAVMQTPAHGSTTTLPLTRPAEPLAGTGPALGESKVTDVRSRLLKPTDCGTNVTVPSTPPPSGPGGEELSVTHV
jgi:hypothetical protein